jgi:formate hydrogenlyase transcriptional activator
MVETPSFHATSPAGALSGNVVSERYEALIRVSQAISAHRDIKDVFEAIATELHRVIQFDGIVVSQYDEASNEILWKACEICREQKASLPDIPADETITKWGL